MKMKGTWVAWIAALALAAILVAPREGAAGPPGPYKMPEDPPGPVLGEPDLPGGSPQLIQMQIGLWLRAHWLGAWTRSAPRTVVAQSARREGTKRDRRATQ
jgi:hypothetical protein